MKKNPRECNSNLDRDKCLLGALQCSNDDSWGVSRSRVARSLDWKQWKRKKEGKQKRGTRTSLVLLSSASGVSCSSCLPCVCFEIHSNLFHQMYYLGSASEHNYYFLSQCRVMSLRPLRITESISVPEPQWGNRTLYRIAFDLILLK